MIEDNDFENLNSKQHLLLSDSIRLGANDAGDMLFKKALANPGDLRVMDKPEWICPVIGDHVEIISWDTQCHVQECVRLSKLPFLIVSDIMPVIVGTCEDNYYWSYEICVEDSNLQFLQWHYKIMR